MERGPEGPLLEDTEGCMKWFICCFSCLGGPDPEAWGPGGFDTCTGGGVQHTCNPGRLSSTWGSGWGEQACPALCSVSAGERDIPGTVSIRSASRVSATLFSFTTWYE